LQPGQQFQDIYPLKLETDVPEPIAARVTINLFDFDSDTRAGFPALAADGQEVTPLVGQIKIRPRSWPEYQPAHAARVTFGDAIALIGYDLEAGITLYWESLAPVNHDYVVFIHLLDPTGQAIAQADAPPTGNAYPTSWWAPGEVIADRHPLPVTAGAVSLRFGLYDLDSGLRLPITASTLPTQDNGVEIKLP
jgi:hypothetical protein